jgi:thiol-disulfide isomerase/thioredoxin
MRRKTFGVVLAGCLTLAFFLVSTAANAEPKVGKKVNLKFGKTMSADDQNYLGLAKPGPFSRKDIKAPYLLVEVFSTTCSHCQAGAPAMNNFFQLVSQNPSLKDKLKVIGSGFQDNEFKLMYWKQNFETRFPLVADLEGDVFRAVDAGGTPTIVVLDQDGKIVFVHEGVFRKAEDFLKEIMPSLK